MGRIYKVDYGAVSGGGRKSCVKYINGSVTSPVSITDDTTGEAFTPTVIMFMATYNSTSKMSGYYNADTSTTSYVRTSGNSQDSPTIPNGNTGLQDIGSNSISVANLSNMYLVALA